MPKPIVVEVKGEVAAPIRTVDAVFRPIDLTTIMRGYGPLPAVVAVEDQTGDWSSVGASRILRLADGHAMLETLTAVDGPNGFGYTLSNLTNALRFLVTRFHGRWSFVEHGASDGSSRVEATWRYTFELRSRLARPFAWVILRCFWRPYMARALALASAEAVRVHEADPRGAPPPSRRDGAQEAEGVT